MFFTLSRPRSMLPNTRRDSFCCDACFLSGVANHSLFALTAGDWLRSFIPLSIDLDGDRALLATARDPPCGPWGWWWWCSDGVFLFTARPRLGVPVGVMKFSLSSSNCFCCSLANFLFGTGYLSLARFLEPPRSNNGVASGLTLLSSTRGEALPILSSATSSSPPSSDVWRPRGESARLEGGLDDVALLNIGKASPLAAEDNNVKPEATPLFERGGSKNRASERYPVPNKKLAKEQQKQLEEDKENFITPTGTPRRGRAVKRNTPSEHHHHQPQGPQVGSLAVANNALSPSKSMDSGMNDLSQSPAVKANNEWFATPDKKHASQQKESRRVFGSIERGLDKVKNMLTPRRRMSSRDGGPATVSGKALCNVSTTSHHNPEAVLSELTRALISKGIPCQQKGFILRGKISDPSGLAKLSFELEVVRIPNLNIVGIRRKRLKGDAWCYKKVCEEVLRMAAVAKQ